MRGPTEPDTWRDWRIKVYSGDREDIEDRYDEYRAMDGMSAPWADDHLLWVWVSRLRRHDDFDEAPRRLSGLLWVLRTYETVQDIIPFGVSSPYCWFLPARVDGFAHPGSAPQPSCWPAFLFLPFFYEGFFRRRTFYGDLAYTPLVLGSLSWFMPLLFCLCQEGLSL